MESCEPVRLEVGQNEVVLEYCTSEVARDVNICTLRCMDKNICPSTAAGCLIVGDAFRILMSLVLAARMTKIGRNCNRRPLNHSRVIDMSKLMYDQYSTHNGSLDVLRTLHSHRSLGRSCLTESSVVG
jgi:hypothetical protein